MQRRVSPEGARPDEGHYCDEGEDGPDESDTGGEEAQTLQNMAVSVFCASFSWAVSGKLREEWVARTYTISNERFISKQTESTMQPCGSADCSPHSESGTRSE